MSKDNVEEYKFDNKDYMVLADEADRNYYFTDDKGATKPKGNLKFTKTKEEFVEFIARQFLKDRGR